MTEFRKKAIAGLKQGDSFAVSRTFTEHDTRSSPKSTTVIELKAEAVFKNQRDEIVIEAHLTGIIPGTSEKIVMAAMLAEGDPTNKCR
jgi:hypothetical protein